MSRLDEIAGQGPVAKGKHHMSRYITIGTKDLAENQPLCIQRDWANADPLYTTDPAPLIALIRQLGDALEAEALKQTRWPLETREALSALTEFDKGEG